MASKLLYHDIDLVKVSQILNARAHNITTTDRTTLGGTLNSTHKGLFVFDTDLNSIYVWGGAAWVSAGSVSGAMVFRGVVAFNASEPVTPATGDFYLFSNAGTNTWEGSTVVEAGDSVVWDGTAWKFIQTNVVDATEAVKGVVELASTAEAQAGTATNVVSTPANVKSWTDQIKAAKTYFASGLSLVANTPLSIAHNLALQNRNAFTINVMDSTHSQISVDVDSTDQNNLTVTSSIALTGVSVTVIGF